jgi:predicted nucleic acid-binding protein
LAETEEWIRSFTRLVVPSHTLDVIREDPSGNRILACAVEAGSEYIATGDKDLHRLGQYGRARVMRVADLLDILQG